MGDVDASSPPPPTPPTPPPPQLITLEEVSKHATGKDCWMVIHGKVYNVTDFLDEHPGGDEVMISSSGKDATEDFEDVGHSTAARKQLDDYYVGEYDVNSAPVKPTTTSKDDTYSFGKDGSSSSTSVFTKVLQFLVPVAILALAVAVRYLTKKEVKPQSTSV